jgi:NAD(P)-dependent dehydrogenase (short-subunit alcohol dehydrogenase family)
MSSSVLVTGANSGIGLAAVLELAAAGYDVVGTARTADKAERVTSAAAERGVSVRTVLMDVDDADSCRRALDEVAGLTGGGPWAVVNNAGYAQSGAVEDVSDEQVRAQLETNLVAPGADRPAGPAADAERGEGRIVNVSSVAGRVLAAADGLVLRQQARPGGGDDALRMEVEPDGVRVVLVEPGAFGTGIWSAAQDGGFPEPATERYAAAYARAATAADRGTASMPDPVWVARTIRVALANPVPLARYVVGGTRSAGSWPRRWSPPPSPTTSRASAAAAGTADQPFRR